MDGPVPPERNIVNKAVALFRRETGFDGGVRVAVEKRIPFGAGLGGGSSDAAAALLGMDELSGMKVPFDRLEVLAAELGSDVPFFLYGGTALVYGRGEVVRPINGIGGYSVVLAAPGFSSDTAKAYRLLDEARENGTLGSGRQIGPAALEEAACGDPSGWPFYNDFLSVLRLEEPSYDTLIKDLQDSGACFVGLSGSGSVCFGVFSDPEQASAAEVSLKALWPFVASAVPLARTGKAVLE